MDNQVAIALIKNLLEKVEGDEQYAGLTSMERNALRLAVAALENTPVQMHVQRPGTNTNRPTTQESDQHQAAGTTESKLDKREPQAAVKLCLAALQRTEAPSKDVMLCLDFGTAMSKAFAQIPAERKHLDLALGAEAGGQGYALPSSLFVGDDGRMYFGFEAIDRSQQKEGAGRQRIDSIKSWLNLGSETNLDGEQNLLQGEQNPTETKLTLGDVTRLYLAYLTDVSARALESAGVGAARYVRRRFARPCGRDMSQAEWIDARMSKMLAQAQILADTFTGRWEGGILVPELKDALEQIADLEKLPEDLIEGGVAEPVAVAAGLILDSDNQKDAYMVVDVGAGTTDFGVFFGTKRPKDGEPLIHQNPSTVIGAPFAGDTVDRLLKGYIARQHAIDAGDPAGNLILNDLGRQIRTMKEVLFKRRLVEYVLQDGISGVVRLDEFLRDPGVKRMQVAMEKKFEESVSALGPTWFKWLSMPGAKLQVILTGGGANLPMVQKLAEGSIVVHGYELMRAPADARPAWIARVSEEFDQAYQQLAVAIGGAQPDMPETVQAPQNYAGGRPSTRYVAANVQISGV